MSLKKFQEKNKKKNQIIIFTIVCISLIGGVFLYQSYALFETKDNFNVVSGSVENPGDLSFAFYVNDEIVLEAPSKESNLALSEKSNCNNGVTVSWNVESWNASVDYSNYKQEKTSKTKCNLFFREAMYSDYVTSCGENGNTAVDCMKKYSDKDTINLVYDETVDNNLRYIGADPNNYVSFNNELWRIIGVMENIDDGTGKKDARIKLIRDKSIGAYSWDSSPANINSGQGINEWSVSDIQSVLNNYYYNSLDNQLCYVEENNKSTTCNFGAIGLINEVKILISNAVWHTGTNGSNDLQNNGKGSAGHFYTYERSNNSRKICSNPSNCNDSAPTTTTWTGNVALIYPSDYGYATSGDINSSRNTCLESSLYLWRKEELHECRENNWLNSNVYKYTITPYAHYYHSDEALYISKEGFIDISYARHDMDIFPTLYLKWNVKMISGYGTKEQPYRLTM